MFVAICHYHTGEEVNTVHPSTCTHYDNFFLFFAGDVSKHKLEHAVSISTMFVYLFFNYSSYIPLFGLRTYCGSIFLGLAS